MVKCPKCNKNIGELEEKCPYCGTTFEEGTLEDESEFLDNKVSGENTKTTLLKIINVTQLIGFFIMTLIIWCSEEEGAILEGFICLIIGIVAFAFIKGFYNIIDLLENINDKLN